MTWAAILLALLAVSISGVALWRAEHPVLAREYLGPTTYIAPAICWRQGSQAWLTRGDGTCYQEDKP